jgi:hypothetical protein
MPGPRLVKAQEYWQSMYLLLIPPPLLLSSALVEGHTPPLPKMQPARPSLRIILSPSSLLSPHQPVLQSDTTLTATPPAPGRNTKFGGPFGGSP